MSMCITEKIYKIKSIEHSRIMNEVTLHDNGYMQEVCIGEAGLEAFSKTHDIAIVKRDENSHIVSFAQKEYTMSGGFEGCFFEFIPEEAIVLR